MTFRERYAAALHDRKFILSALTALVFLVISLVINYFAAVYAADRASNYVTDIILSNIPVFDVDSLFVWGPIIFWTIMTAIVLYDPKRFPFWLKSVALFVVTRSIFISLTHLGPYPDQLPMDAIGGGLLQDVSSRIYFSFFTSGSDLFFSGHTGLPFLMALMFWGNRPIRWFCLISSVFFGIVVLLGHMHYSIDVASAFFITYGIFHISELAFKKDRARFLENGSEVLSTT